METRIDSPTNHQKLFRDSPTQSPRCLGLIGQWKGKDRTDGCMIPSISDSIVRTCQMGWRKVAN